MGKKEKTWSWKWSWQRSQKESERNLAIYICHGLGFFLIPVTTYTCSANVTSIQNDLQYNKKLGSDWLNIECSGRVGLCSERKCIFSGFQFTRQFIEFVVVETKQIVSNNSNVILTRQTCGQRSGMAAANKRRALAFYFVVRIQRILRPNAFKNRKSALRSRYRSHATLLYIQLSSTFRYPEHIANSYGKIKW